jgi:hypothetical protein
VRFEAKSRPENIEDILGQQPVDTFLKKRHATKSSFSSTFSPAES